MVSAQLTLSHISLFSFKNYEHLHLEFQDGVNCLVGRNGTGKTNLLDAIHYLCMSKSALSSQDQYAVQHSSDFFSVSGTFRTEHRADTILCHYKKGQKKTLKCNKKEYDRLSEHIGKYPCVILTPDDTELVKEGSEIRRRYFDATLSQADRAYLNQLIRYNHALKQRNSLLKQFAESGRTDHDLLEPYNELLIGLSAAIYEARRQFIEQFEPRCEAQYAFLSGQRESVTLRYKPDFEEGFERVFRAALRDDLHAQRTTRGIHKDDFEFCMGGTPIKRFGSQGQQKTFVIALKLAQYEMLENILGVKPILLLDDIFDKLDDDRIGCLLELLASGKYGQIFLTDARPERSAKLFDGAVQQAAFYHIEPLGSRPYLATTELAPLSQVAENKPNDDPAHPQQSA